MELVYASDSGARVLLSHDAARECCSYDQILAFACSKDASGIQLAFLNLILYLLKYFCENIGWFTMKLSPRKTDSNFSQ